MIWHDLVHVQIPLGEKALRTVLVYLALYVLLRLGGKRDLAQLNSFDLIVVLLLSNVVQNAVIGPDNSVAGGLLGAVILLSLNGALVRLARLNGRLARILDGTPAVLLRDGKFIDSAMRREGLRRDDVEAMLRRQNANDASEVSLLTLAPGGALVVQLREEEQGATKGDLAALERRLTALLER